MLYLRFAGAGESLKLHVLETAGFTMFGIFAFWFSEVIKHLNELMVVVLILSADEFC